MKIPVPDFSHWQPHQRFSLLADFQENEIAKVEYDPNYRSADNWLGTLYVYVSLDHLAVGEEFDFFERKIPLCKTWNLAGEPQESKRNAACHKGEWKIFPNSDYKMALKPTPHPSVVGRIVACRLVILSRRTNDLVLEIVIPRK